MNEGHPKLTDANHKNEIDCNNCANNHKEIWSENEGLAIVSWHCKASEGRQIDVRDLESDYTPIWCPLVECDTEPVTKTKEKREKGGGKTT